MTLPNDVARCQGIGYEEEDGFHWREGCEDCLRRTSPPGEVKDIEPPPIIVFECEYRIDPSYESSFLGKIDTSPTQEVLERWWQPLG